MTIDPAKTSVLRALRHVGSTTVEIAALYPLPFSTQTSGSSNRSYSELLRHTAWIPKEEVLLWHGLSRSQIQPRLGVPIMSTTELQLAVDEAIAFFEEELSQLQSVAQRS
jgi:hypothetical protein